MKEILIASNNKDKLSEIRKIFDNEDLRILSLKDIGIEIEVIEDQETLEGNALKKAKEIFEISKIPTISDDTGLFVKVLNGEPGVYSSRYAGENVSYDDNCQKLIKNMKGIPETKREAYFKTIICFYFEKDKHDLFEGICNGKIINQKRGAEGFGYDPLFIPDGYKKTFAEMNEDEKNKISHRGRALMKLKEFMDTKFRKDTYKNHQ
jgi:XTP/dITP diphosphohydrolase